MEPELFTLAIILMMSVGILGALGSYYIKIKVLGEVEQIKDFESFFCLYRSSDNEKWEKVFCTK